MKLATIEAMQDDDNQNQNPVPNNIDDDDPQTNDMPYSPTFYQDDQKHDAIKQAQPEISDEEDMSGDTPLSGSDRVANVLDEAHELDLYPNADEEHPVPVGLGPQIDAAEKHRE